MNALLPKAREVMNALSDGAVIRTMLAETVGSIVVSVVILAGDPARPYYIHHANNKSEWDDHYLTLSKDQLSGIFDNAMTQGLLIASSGAYVSEISGGHLNPAITLGALICGYIKVIPALCYIVLQITGALLGQYLATLVTHKRVLGKDIYLKEASDFGLGMMSSFLLVSVFLSVSDKKRQKRNIGSGALTVGLSMTGTMYAMRDYRGCINPAISLAMSVYYSDFRGSWPYWVAPFLGGLLAGIVYRLLNKHHTPSFLRFNPSTVLDTILANTT